MMEIDIAEALSYLTLGVVTGVILVLVFLRC